MEKLKWLRQQKIHVLGSCGTLMSGIVQLGLSLGLEITGSDDAVYAPLGTLLPENCRQPLGLSCIDRDHIVIVANKFKRTDHIIVELMRSGVKLWSCMDFLKILLDHKKVIAIAGTHGKTTTTSLLIWLLHQAGYQPGYLVGGLPKNLPCNASWGNGEYFVLEADEYDTAFFDKTSKCLHLWPYGLILNTIEFDHADIFDSFAQIQKVFNWLIRKVHPNGWLVSSPQPYFQGQFPVELQVHHNVMEDLTVVHGILLYQGTAIERWPMMFGVNLINISLAVRAAKLLGLTHIDIVNGLKSFSGVARRQELFEYGELKFWHDFGHHPVAIENTIDALQERAPLLSIWIEKASNSMKQGAFDESLHDLKNRKKEQNIAIYFDQEGISLQEFILTCKQIGSFGILFSNKPSTYEQVLCAFSTLNQEASQAS